MAQVASGAVAYSFTGVPDGTYIALAAFGIDGDVRDESGTGNTAPVQVTVQGGALQGSVAQFALVQAISPTSIDGVAVTSSGVPIQIASATRRSSGRRRPPTSQATTFRAEVFDAFGTAIWTHEQNAAGTGPFSDTSSTLQSGMYYQLRVTALDIAGNPLSQTEDLKGVFFKP